MQTIRALLLLLAASVVTAAQNPHEKAPKYVQKRSTEPVLSKHASRAVNMAQFLNKKTAGMTIFSLIPSIPWLIASRICRQWLCIARGRLQYWGVVCWYSTNI